MDQFGLRISKPNMRVTAIFVLICGAALAASPRGESQRSSATPAAATPVESPAEGAEGDKRDKRQWFAGGFNPGFNPGFNANPYGGFNPRQWWGNNYAAAGFGGRSGMSQIQWQQYMQQMIRFMRNPPTIINTGAQFTGARSGVRPNGNILPDVIDTRASGAMQFLPMSMLQYMYSNGFAPPFRPNQPVFFQRSWQQYFSQFTNRLPGATFDLRPQREINTDSVNGRSGVPMESSFGSPIEDTMTGSS